MDPYFLKTIEYKYKEVTYFFDVAYTIFSTNDIDVGTQLLIRKVDLSYTPKSILDLGCGYGVLGIVLSDQLKIPNVSLVDTNLLSLRYAKKNLKRNNVEATIFPSVGLENVPLNKYDLIVSNIPAKIGDTAIEEDFILKPLTYLNDGCEYWFVVVSGLNRLIPGIGKRNNLDMKLIDKRKRYSVYRIIKE